MEQKPRAVSLQSVTNTSKGSHLLYHKCQKRDVVWMENHASLQVFLNSFYAYELWKKKVLTAHCATSVLPAPSKGSQSSNSLSFDKSFDN